MATRPLISSLSLAVQLLVLSATGSAQDGSPASSIPSAPGGGQGEIAAQGYYLSNNSQSTIGTSGLNFKFDEFVPHIGLLTGNLEAYRTQGTIKPADNYLSLRGLVLGGVRWNFTGGDFRSTGAWIQNPFTNLYFPEIQARGFQMDVGDSKTGFMAFYGNETLLAGPRIPFRVDVPQKVYGAGVRRALGKLQTGVRLLHLESTGQQDAAGGLTFFQPGRQFQSADNLTFYTGLKLGDHFRWYGEATATRSALRNDSLTRQPLSYFFGPSWESPIFTFRANYAYLSNSYLPVAGYSVGDRKGPFAEFRVKPISRVEIFGSANRYQTVLKNDSLIPDIRSTGATGGVSVELPGSLYASVQLSKINYSSSNVVSQSFQTSNNQQWTGTLSRRFGRQTYRFTGRDMRLVNGSIPDRERSEELEDTVQWRHLILGGAVRYQQSATSEQRNTIYLRGSAQINAGRFSLSGYFEGGKDLVNQSVFATSTTSSTFVTGTVRVTRKWSVQAEVFRSRLLSSANPENIFVQGNQGLMTSPVLSTFNQWSFLFRVARSFQWGAGLPVGGGALDQFTIQHIPLTGTLEGMVSVLVGEMRLPASGVSLVLESGRTVMTDNSGKYRFDDVPEGSHVVGINMEELPADYDPGPVTKAAVMVGPRKTVRSDLNLYGLSGVIGRVIVREGSSFATLEGIVIRLQPGSRYTTTTKDGDFGFYNLPSGNYQAVLDDSSLPEEAKVDSDVSVSLQVGLGNTDQHVGFEIERRAPDEMPVRRVIEQKIDAPLTESSPIALKPIEADSKAMKPNTEAPINLAKSSAVPEPSSSTKVSAAKPAPLPKPEPPSRSSAIPSASASAHNARGRALTDQGKYREAIAELDEAIRLKSGYALALNARGFVYYLMHDYTRALADLDEAIRLNPNYSNAYHNRSQVRRVMGDYAGSSEDEKKSR